MCLLYSELSTVVTDPKDEMLINYLEDRYEVDIAIGDDVKAHVYRVDDLVFVSESVSSNYTKILKSELFFTRIVKYQNSSESCLFQ